jgi:hypothetical protein
MEKKRRLLIVNIKLFSIIVGLLVILLLLASCSQEHHPNEGVSHKKAVGAGAYYILMEKVLADAPGRPRTTMKILILKAANRDDVSAALTRALADAHKDDPTLKSVIIWAYRTRAELNGSNFILGKLEWSADGKDFAGQKPLSPNPKTEIVLQ